MRDPAMRKYVPDLAHRMGHAPRPLHPVQQRGRRRRDRKVAPVPRPPEIPRRPQERPRDRPPHPHRMKPRRQIAAQPDQPLQPEHLFMRGNLEHAVGARIADGPPRPQMLGPQPVDDLRPRGMAIAKDPANTRQPAHLRHQIIGKGRHRIRKIGPVPRHRHPRQFPMPRRRILAPRHLGRSTPKPRRHRRKPRHRMARGQPHRRPQPQRIEVGQMQRPAPPLLRTPLRTGRRDMAQRVGPRIAKGIGIRRAATSDGIHHHQKGPRHHPTRFRIKGGSSGADVPTR